MPLMVILIPAMQLAGLLGFVGVWGYYCMYIASLGDITTVVEQKYNPYFKITVHTTYKEVAYSPEVKEMGWFMLFMYFWTTQFVIALGSLVTAMCICCWYFTREKKKVGNTTVFTAVWMIARFHMGTAAFGAFLIAVVKMIRAVLTYVEAQARAQDNRVAKLVLRVLIACSVCLERCIKFITINAYIQTCIRGTDFCTSARNAFWLIFRNLARISVVSAVSTFVILIGKVFVCAATGGVFYQIMTTLYDGELGSVVIMTGFVCLLAFATATMFFELFGMAITTLLQCFVADEEMFMDSVDGVFADGELKKLINRSKKKKSKKNKGPKYDRPATSKGTRRYQKGDVLKFGANWWSSGPGKPIMDQLKSKPNARQGQIVEAEETQEGGGPAYKIRFTIEAGGRGCCAKAKEDEDERQLTFAAGDGENGVDTAGAVEYLHS
jgi:choline transporter-like protein 2/4/5